MKWRKRLIYNLGGIRRYEYINDSYTIDVTNGKTQGYAGSNQVNVFSEKYGGWLLGTPLSFKTKAQADGFAKRAMIKLNRGDEGHKVSFPR